MIISSFFTFNAIPAVGLSPLPTLLIWSVTGSGETLVVPSAAMNEVGDGFYQYLFSAYDPTQEYVFRVDGGPTYVSDNPERYQAGAIQVATITSSTITNIASQVWEEPLASHVTPSTFGYLDQQTNANTIAIAQNLYLNANSVLDLVQLLLKYDTNRTKIDPTAMTLTVYEDDCTTPLRVFKLLDTTGAPSITQVAERKPISANDGLPVCP
jgi:hypothetical protein